MLLLIAGVGGLLGAWIVRRATPDAPEQRSSREARVPEVAEKEPAPASLPDRVRVAVVPAHVPTSEPVGADESEPDAAWHELPVTHGGITFPERFLAGPLGSFPVDRLFRSRDLNPGDVHVPSEQRSALTDFVEQQLAELSEMKHALQQAGYQWLVDRIASGEVLPLRLEDTKEVARSVAESAPGAVLLDPDLYEGAEALDRLYSIGGKVYGLSFARSPITREAWEQLTFRRQQLAIRVGEWFHAAGCLEQPSWRLYLERVYAPR